MRVFFRLQKMSVLYYWNASRFFFLYLNEVRKSDLSLKMTKDGIICTIFSASLCHNRVCGLKLLQLSKDYFCSKLLYCHFRIKCPFRRRRRCKTSGLWAVKTDSGSDIVMYAEVTNIYSAEKPRTECKYGWPLCRGLGRVAWKRGYSGFDVLFWKFFPRKVLLRCRSGVLCFALHISFCVREWMLPERSEIFHSRESALVSFPSSPLREKQTKERSSWSPKVVCVQ